MSGASAAASSSVSVAKKSPSDYLKSLVGRPVVVRLTSGVDYRGASLLPRRTASRRVHTRCAQCETRHLAAACLPACPSHLLSLLLSVLIAPAVCHPHRSLARRHSHLLGRLHERCAGADGGVDERRAFGQVWRRFSVSAPGGVWRARAAAAGPERCRRERPAPPLPPARLRCSAVDRRGNNVLYITAPKAKGR